MILSILKNLPKHIAFTLEHNPHTLVYMSAAEWMGDGSPALVCAGYATIARKARKALPPTE